MKIVIADDSFLFRDRIKFLLKNIDDNSLVYEASNGPEALRLVKEVEPDLVILDIRMPVMNGIDVLKKIREMKLQVKICMFTNYSYPQYKCSCFDAGADFFLSKTEEFDDIREVITEILNNSDIAESGQK